MRYIYYSDSLYHHGVKGQKWGVRRFQNEDGSYTAAGQAENNGHGRYSDSDSVSPPGKVNDGKKSDYGAKKKGPDKKNESKIASAIKNRYKLSDEQYENYKKTAKIIGVSLAATAGVLAVAYVVNNKTDFISKLQNTSVSDVLSQDNNIESGKTFVETHITQGYDASAAYGLSRTSLVDDINDTIDVGDPIGTRARLNGYAIADNGYDLIHSAREIEFPQSLHEDCIVNQRYSGLFGPMNRRLSCWSGSHSYLLSRMTGRQYCSRNYQNLVEFNSFGSLYTSKQNIVDLFGNKANDFVGEFGKNSGSKIKGVSDAKKLINTIYSNFTKANTVDGGIVGFVDAAYRGTTCTHQWNFEISKQGVLSMIDTWSGEKYDIASRGSSGRISYNLENLLQDKGNGTSFLGELYHYNRESFRMYSPSLDDLDLDKMAEIMLAKIK